MNATLPVQRTAQPGNDHVAKRVAAICRERSGSGFFIGGVRHGAIEIQSHGNGDNRASDKRHLGARPVFAAGIGNMVCDYGRRHRSDFKFRFGDWRQVDATAHDRTSTETVGHSNRNFTRSAGRRRGLDESLWKQSRRYEVSETKRQRRDAHQRFRKPHRRPVDAG